MRKFLISLKKQFAKKSDDVQYYVSSYLSDVRMNHFKCDTLKEAKRLLEIMQEVKPEYKWMLEGK